MLGCFFPQLKKRENDAGRCKGGTNIGHEGVIQEHSGQRRRRLRRLVSVLAVDDLLILLQLCALH